MNGIHLRQRVKEVRPIHSALDVQHRPTCNRNASIREATNSTFNRKDDNVDGKKESKQEKDMKERRRRKKKLDQRW